MVEALALQALMGMAGGGGESGGTMNPLKMAGQAAGAIGGAVQMAVGYAQLAKAKKLPFPNYTDGMQYANENMDMYRRQYREGMGQNTLGGIRKETSSATAKTMRSLAETAPRTDTFCHWCLMPLLKDQCLDFLGRDFYT